MSTSARRALGGAALLAIALLAWAGSDAARRTFWTTVDEPYHVTEARGLVLGQGLASHPEQGTLFKLLTAAPLADEVPVRSIDDVRRGRVGFPLVFAGLVLAAGLWVMARSGAALGLATAALLALDPSLRGHGALVKSDVLITATLVATAALLDTGLRARGKARAPLLLAAGLACGLALLSKASGFALLPLLLAAGLVRGGGERRREPVTRRAALLAALFVLPALLTFAAVQETAWRSVPRSEIARSIETLYRGVPAEKAVRRAEDLPKGLGAWVAGVTYLSERGAPGKWCNYLFGRVSGGGFPLYYVVAIALKLTTATVLYVVLAPGLLALALARSGPLRRRRLSRLARSRAGLPLLLGAGYLGLFSAGNVDTGVRYVFPATAFLLVAAAGAVRTVPAARGRRAAALLAVVLLSGAEAWAYRGREISFGNLLAGGPHGLRAALSDSNVEWGQEQGKLFDRVRKGDLGRVGVVTLGLDWPEARRAGVAAWMSRPDDAAVDTVFVSTFYRDLAHALARYDEGLRYPWIAYVRSWLVPLVLTLESRAASVEPFGDGYLLLRLKPPPARLVPPGPGPAAPPRAPEKATP